jgi:hypothetical protein
MQTLCILKREERWPSIIRICVTAAVTYLKITFLRSPEETEESDENFQVE